MVYENPSQIIRLKSDLTLVEIVAKSVPEPMDTTLTQIAQLEDLLTVEQLELFVVEAAMWSPHVSFELQIGEENLNLEARCLALPTCSEKYGELMGTQLNLSLEPTNPRA